MSTLNQLVKSLGNGPRGRGGNTMRRRTNFNSRKRQVPNKNNSSIVIPPYSPSISFTKRFRFAESTGEPFDVVITTADLLQLLSVQGGTTPTNAYYSLLSALRILKTTVYGPPAENLEPVTVTIEYLSPGASSFGSRSRIESGISMGSLGTSVTSNPDPMSYAGSWLNTPNGVSIMAISGPARGIVDLTIEFTFQDDNTPTVYYVAGSFVVPTGKIFINPLDGVSGGVLEPVDYITS